MVSKIWLSVITLRPLAGVNPGAGTDGLAISSRRRALLQVRYRHYLVDDKWSFFHRYGL